MNSVAKLSVADDVDRCRLLADSIAHYAIYMLDPRGRVASWNGSAERCEGYQSREILGQLFSRFYTEEDRLSGTPEHALRQAGAQGRFETEGWRVRKNGERFWAHVVLDAIHGERGEIIGFAKIIRDLSERRLAEAALRKNEEQFRRLVQSVTDYAIYMIDPLGHVSSWNAGAQRIKGYRPEEIIGEHFSRFYTEEDRASGAPQRNLAQATREGRFESEGWRVRRDGSRFMAHVVIDPIRDDDGQILGFAKITRDITERQLAQQALERTQQALLQTQKLESIGQLTGGVAHDFNNLLTAILGSLELLRKRLPDDVRSHTLLDNAIHGAERGAALTQRMLAFARRQELTLQAVHLPGLVDGMMGLLERSIGPRIAIRTQFAQGLPLIRSDPAQLEATLVNLVLNARDAMPDGGSILIAARGENVTDASSLGLERGHYVRISVVDDGQGMDASTLARAPEPFFTTKGVGKGTGLGLSMVQGLTEQSGGRLAIASAPGRGTTIDIWLPVATDESAAAIPASGVDTDARPPRRSHVILVVDDDDLVLLSTCALLDDMGYSVIECTSGMRALELIAQRADIELVITDQVMPGMTGVQLAAAIKELKPGLPIIIASGYAEMPGGLPPRLRRLAKPYRITELAQTVAALLGEEPDRETGPAPAALASH